MFKRLQGDITVAMAASVAVLLASGWVLTWARLAAEGLPSENILAALPHGYFVQIALHVTVVLFSMLVLTGIPWVGWCLKKERKTNKPYPVLAWVAFELLLAVPSVFVSRLLNSGTTRHEPDYIRWTIAAVLVCVAAAAALARVLNKYLSKRIAAEASPVSLGANTIFASWSAARPLAALTLFLCVLTGTTIRVVDARFTADPLPLGNAVLNIPCSSVTHGIPPVDRNPKTGQPIPGTMAPQPERCLIAGFYLGENDNWVYFVQREDPCTHKPKSPPQLVAIRRDAIQELAVLRDTGCKKKKTNPR